LTEGCADLARRLRRAGLTSGEVDLLIALYGKAIFGTEDMVVAMRLAPEVVDALAPIDVLPRPNKIVRVALLVSYHLDPTLQDRAVELIAQLGDPNYQRRESAERRLGQLGTRAVPLLRRALGHSDAEVVFRAERLLLDLSEDLDRP
jgi:hypothetical protein